MPAKVARSVSLCFAFSARSFAKNALTRTSLGASSAAREMSLIK